MLLLKPLRRPSNLLLLAGLCAAAGCGPPPIEMTAAARPDVLLVIWDTTRPDHLTPYGYHRDTTPRLAEIAAGGTVFENAHSSGIWTVPAMASMFTGLFGHNHRVDWEWEEDKRSMSLTESVTTLAEALEQTGYTTGLITVQGIYYEEDGFLQGFDRHDYVQPDRLVREGLRYIDRYGSPNPRHRPPFFLVLYWMDPHSPYEPQEEHDLWSDPRLPPYTITSRSDDDGVAPAAHELPLRAINRDELEVTPAQMEQMIALYDGELRGNDAGLGEIWQRMEELSLTDRTVFVLTSDHGEAFGDHPNHRFFHGVPYEANQRVPLILRWPEGVPAGRRVPSMVRTIDIYPPLLERADAAPPAHRINGQSLLPLLTGSGPDRPYVVANHFRGGELAFHAGSYKLIVRRRTDQAELYEIRNDPREMNDLALGQPELALTWRERLARFLQGTRIDLEGAGEDKATDEEMQRIRALGYVD